MDRLRRGRRKYVPVGSVAASMRLTPLHNLPTRPRTCSVCVHHGKQRRKSKATAGRFARSTRSSFRWIYIHQLTNEKSRADARLHRECFIHAWRGSTVSTRVDTHQQQHRRRSDSSGKLSKAGWCRVAGCPRHGWRGQAYTDVLAASPQPDTIPPSHGYLAFDVDVDVAVAVAGQRPALPTTAGAGPQALQNILSCAFPRHGATTTAPAPSAPPRNRSSAHTPPPPAHRCCPAGHSGTR